MSEGEDESEGENMGAGDGEGGGEGGRESGMVYRPCCIRHQDTCSLRPSFLLPFELAPPAPTYLRKKKAFVFCFLLFYFST